MIPSGQKTEARPFPIALDVELDSRCNLRCPMCPRSQPSFFRKCGPMSWGVVEAVAAGIKAWKDSSTPARWVWAHLGGESLLNPDAPEMVGCLVRAGKGGKGPFSVAMSTNAVCLSRNVMERLMSSGMHRIIVSLDAVTKETYEKIRVGAKFEQVMGRVNELLKIAAWRQENGLRVPAIWLQVLKLPENEGEVLDFINRYAAKKSSVVVKHSPLRGLRNGRVFAKEVERYGGQVEGVIGTWGWDKADERRLTCRKVWERMAVFSDGQAGICCYDVGQTLVVGSVLDGGIAAVWRGEAYEKLRGDWLDGKLPALCEKC